MTTSRTGTLIVVSGDPDVAEPEARLHYRDGTLVAAVLGPSSGEQALRGMLGWKDGFFEFLTDTEPPERTDAGLHAAALAEIKSWYAAKTSSRPALAGNRSAPGVQVPRASSPSISRPEIVPVALRALPVAPAPKPPPSVAIGSGVLDARANLSDVVGTLSPKDGAVAFASLQVAATIGKDMVMGAPVSIEVHTRDRWIAAAVRGDGAVLVVCPPDSAIGDELARKLGS